MLLFSWCFCIIFIFSMLMVSLTCSNFVSGLLNIYCRSFKFPAILLSAYLRLFILSPFMLNYRSTFISCSLYTIILMLMLRCKLFCRIPIHLESIEQLFNFYYVPFLRPLQEFDFYCYLVLFLVLLGFYFFL